MAQVKVVKQTAGIYLGIDPGLSGGLATLATYDPPEANPMPSTERDVWDWIRWYNDRSDVFAVIEKVSGFAGKGHPGSAMFKFGQSYGGLRMALIAAGIPFEEITPQKWQKGLGITTRKKDEKRGDFKNRLKARAQQLFPDVKVTLAIADALLIAEYCRRYREGKL